MHTELENASTTQHHISTKIPKSTLTLKLSYVLSISSTKLAKPMLLSLAPKLLSLISPPVKAQKPGHCKPTKLNLTRP